MDSGLYGLLLIAVIVVALILTDGLLPDNWEGY